MNKLLTDCMTKNRATERPIDQPIVCPNNRQKNQQINQQTEQPKRETMYIKCNTEARLRNCCCRGKAINITYFSFCAWVWVHGRGRVALLIQYTTRKHHIVCGLPNSTTFSTLSHKQQNFRKRKD
jgi:hypothetical protein